MNGKGSKLRSGANLQKYWNNYNSIFRKPKNLLTELELEEKKNNMSEMSYSEFKKIESRNEKI